MKFGENEENVEKRDEMEEKCEETEVKCGETEKNVEKRNEMKDKCKNGGGQLKNVMKLRRNVVNQVLDAGLSEISSAGRPSAQGSSQDTHPHQHWRSGEAKWRNKKKCGEIEDKRKEI